MPDWRAKRFEIIEKKIPTFLQVLIEVKLISSWTTFSFNETIEWIIDIQRITRDNCYQYTEKCLDTHTTKLISRIQVSDDDNDYSYDVEDFLLRIIFHNLYNFGSIVSYCQPYVDCTTECTKCPENNYEQFAKKVSFKRQVKFKYLQTKTKTIWINRSELIAVNSLLIVSGTMKCLIVVSIFNRLKPLLARAF